MGVHYGLVKGRLLGEGGVVMKVEFTYHCSSCGELLTAVAQGACPICGSQAVVPLGWYQISIRERKDWLQRIRGLRRKAASPKNEREEKGV
jgi:rRNA maturation endonuclease Nob1